MASQKFNEAISMATDLIARDPNEAAFWVTVAQALAQQATADAIMDVSGEIRTNFSRLEVELVRD